MSYTIVGGAVNLASRLENEAPPGGILVSYETYAHVKDTLACEARGEIRVKGIAHPVTTFQVTGVRDPVAGSSAPEESDWLSMVERNPASLSEAERREVIARLSALILRMSRFGDESATAM
jgi:hypothetical protein